MWGEGAVNELDSAATHSLRLHKQLEFLRVVDLLALQNLLATPDL